MEVIEAVVIVAVAVTLAIVFAFFVTNLVFTRTGVELLDVSYSLSNNGLLTLYVRNRGTQPVSVVLVKVDGEAYPQPVYIEPGGTATLSFFVGRAQRVHEVRIVTSSGAEYTLLVKP